MVLVIGPRGNGALLDIDFIAIVGRRIGERKQQLLRLRDVEREELALGAGGQAGGQRRSQRERRDGGLIKLEGVGAGLPLRAMDRDGVGAGRGKCDIGRTGGGVDKPGEAVWPGEIELNGGSFFVDEREPDYLS